MTDETPDKEVVIRDVRMPFGSMVVFMLKWAIASIPALVILVAVAAIVWRLVAGGGELAAGPSPAAPGAAKEESASTWTAASGGEVSLTLGEQVYRIDCEVCHGRDGRGSGTAGADLTPGPRDLHQASMDTLSDALILDRIVNGKPGTGMPAWRGVLNDTQIKSVLLKVRSFREP
jgi:mono/diheme cytochrome c family protein